MQRKQPPVRMLAIDLEDEKVITFNDDGTAQNLLDSGPPATTLTAFFEVMHLYPNMLHIVYPDVFKHFTYTHKRFQLRKKKITLEEDCMTDTVGEIPIIAFNPHTAELFHLRILL